MSAAEVDPSTHPLFGEQLAILRESWAGLSDKPEESPESSLRALWLAAAGAPCSAAAAHERPLPPLDAERAARLRELVRQRVSSIPLAHLTGRQRFLGLEMLAGPGALIPRRETELLTRAAVALAQQAVAERGRALVIDLCTGSGNIALAIAAHTPGASVYAADLSADAVALARENAIFLGLVDRVEFATGDLFAPFDSEPFLGSVDVLTCNPPYISSAKVSTMATEIAGHEPRLAFDGGSFGVDILFRLISNAPRFIRPGGHLCFEVGLGQGKGIAQRLERAGAYEEVRPLTDEAGHVRALTARLRSN